MSGPRLQVVEAWEVSYCITLQVKVYRPTSSLYSALFSLANRCIETSNLWLNLLRSRMFRFQGAASPLSRRTHEKKLTCQLRVLRLSEKSLVSGEHRQGNTAGVSCIIAARPGHRSASASGQRSSACADLEQPRTLSAHLLHDTEVASPLRFYRLARDHSSHP